MTIDRLPRPPRGCDLRHHLAITREHTRPIHHLGEVTQARIRKKSGDGLRIEHRTGCLKRGRGHATRHAKQYRHTGLRPFREHVRDPRFA